jgi:CBS domain-containing protein
VKPLAWRRAERARATRSGRSEACSILERVRHTVRPVVNDQPVLGIFAADLLVDLGRRRGGPGPKLDQKRVSLRVVEDLALD